MDLGLNKLPWWGQLALYVVVGAGLVATHHYMYAVDLEAKVSRTHAERRKIETGIARARVEERRLPEFRSRVDALIDAMHATPPLAGGQRVRVPGEQSHATAERRSREGVPLPADVVKAVRELGDALGLAWPG